jgi:hypothetical protein
VMETCKRYDAAPVEALQLTVGLVDTPVALFDGEARAGGAGAATIVVKLQKPE